VVEKFLALASAPLGEGRAQVQGRQGCPARVVLVREGRAEEVRSTALAARLGASARAVAFRLSAGTAGAPGSWSGGPARRGVGWATAIT